MNSNGYHLSYKWHRYNFKVVAVRSELRYMNLKDGELKKEEE